MVAALSSLLSALRAAPDVEAALGALAPAMVESLRTPLADADTPAPIALRVIAHRRGAAGYEGLTLHELTARRPAELGATTSAWRLVHAIPGPWLIEVLHRRATPLNAGAATDLALDEGLSARSGAVLSARRASHVFAVPLTDIGGRLGGVLSVELKADPGRADPLQSWRPILLELAVLCELAAPYLLGKALRQPPLEPDPLLPVIGARMAERLGVLDSLARFGDTLLLRGPPGTGKTRLAEWIHRRSGRRGPMERVAVVNLPSELLESELFGWRKGAHATATGDRPGIVAAARGGTLLLDEIGDLPLGAQAKLLRLLESRRYRPLGADREEEADVRFVLATNVDLERAVAEGRFRQDLYDRINGGSLDLPPLASRRDEISRWASVFLQERATALAVPPLELSEEARCALETQPWPGNLRQLAQVLRNALAMALGRGAPLVTLADVTAALTAQGGGVRAGPLAEQIAALGVALADEAIARQKAGGPPLRLNDGEVLRHYALRAARERLGDARAALLAFGEERLIASRNQHAELKRAAREIEVFERRLRGLDEHDRV